MGFEYLAHTADLRCAVEADDREALYATGVDLVRDIVVGSSPVEPVEQRIVELHDGDEPERFFRFVRELVYLYDGDGFLPADLELEAHGGTGTVARIRGERFDSDRHTSERQVKALTRHGYVLERRADGYQAELLFDL